MDWDEARAAVRASELWTAALTAWGDRDWCRVLSITTTFSNATHAIQAHGFVLIYYMFTTTF